jgi:hypothetical protein
LYPVIVAKLNSLNQSLAVNLSEKHYPRAKEIAGEYELKMAPLKLTRDSLYGLVTRVCRSRFADYEIRNWANELKRHKEGYQPRLAELAKKTYLFQVQKILEELDSHCQNNEIDYSEVFPPPKSVSFLGFRKKETAHNFYE